MSDRAARLTPPRTEPRPLSGLGAVPDSAPPGTAAPPAPNAAAGRAGQPPGPSPLFPSLLFSSPRQWHTGTDPLAPQRRSRPAPPWQRDAATQGQLPLLSPVSGWGSFSRGVRSSPSSGSISLLPPGPRSALRARPPGATAAAGSVAWPGPARLGPAQLCPTRLDSTRLGSARLSWASTSPAAAPRPLGSAPPGPGSGGRSPRRSRDGQGRAEMASAPRWCRAALSRHL